MKFILIMISCLSFSLWGVDFYSTKNASHIEEYNITDTLKAIHIFNQNNQKFVVILKGGEFLQAYFNPSFYSQEVPYDQMFAITKDSGIWVQDFLKNSADSLSRGRYFFILGQNPFLEFNTDGDLIFKIDQSFIEFKASDFSFKKAQDFVIENAPMSDGPGISYRGAYPLLEARDNFYPTNASYASFLEGKKCPTIAGGLLYKKMGDSLFARFKNLKDYLKDMLPQETQSCLHFN